jgi:SnoaL-like domain
MTTFAEHRATVESFVDCMHRGADTDALARVLAENVVLTSPLSDEPLTGREAVTEAIQGVSTVAAELTYKEVLSGETHHAAFFRLQIKDTAVDGVDYFLLDADGKIAEVTIWWRPLPTAVEMQGHLAPLVGMQPWELHTRSNNDLGMPSSHVPELMSSFVNGGRFTHPNSPAEDEWAAPRKAR